MENKKQKRIILILAGLLLVALVALAGLLLSQKLRGRPSDSVTVPDNIVASEEGAAASEQAEPTTEQTEPVSSVETHSQESSSVSGSAAQMESTASGSEERRAAVISLYTKHSGDNVPFHAENLFPGDRETKYFCVQVSYQGKVTVKYHADVRPGYEKLAEVLKCRIVLLTDGTLLYDGLMRDMPASLDRVLTSTAERTDTLYYEITAYLDTSVGNDYQNLPLIADFCWWVDESDNLVPPDTGDFAQPLLWAGVAVTSLLLLFLLLIKRRKENEDEE